MATPPFLPDETKPADDDIVSQYPAVERAFRDIVETWLLVNHDTSGLHKWVTMPEQGSKPTSAANRGYLYTKDVSAVTELFYEDSGGTETQITTGGVIQFDLVNDTTPQQGGVLDTNSFAINESEGGPVASATTTDIWSTTGNTVHITGSTTIASFGTAPRVGARRWIIFDGGPTLTHGVNLRLPAGLDATMAAEDIALVYADTVTQFDIILFRRSGVAARGRATQAEMEAASDDNAQVTPVNLKWHPGVANAWVYFEGDAATPNSTKVSYNIGTIVDNGAGSYTVPFIVDQSTATYPVAVNGSNESSGDETLQGGTVSAVNLATGSFRLDTENAAGAQTDMGEVSAIIMGDL